MNPLCSTGEEPIQEHTSRNVNELKGSNQKNRSQSKGGEKMAPRNREGKTIMFPFGLLLPEGGNEGKTENFCGENGRINEKLWRMAGK